VETLPTRRKLLFWGITLSLPALCAVGLWTFWRTRHLDLPSGKKLNRAAWEASFAERGLAVPAGGPRDGYWGSRMPAWVKDPDAGWHEAEVHLPGLVEIDADGAQRLRSDGSPRVLILGGSVAWGAYASRLDETYFAHAAKRLAAAGVPADVTVLAAGAWTSENELNALRRRVLTRPDVVVFLDGLNDLTQGKGLSEDTRVRNYLDHLHEARDLAETKGARVLISLQPTLTGKRRRSALEQRILDIMADKAAIVPSAYARMRVELRGLEDDAGTRFVDCSDAFSGEAPTTFTDIWHFADPGHRLLGDCLVQGLIPMLREVGSPRADP
jgi:GDSL-like Lipase/Acylhydrolase family